MQDCRRMLNEHDAAILGEEHSRPHTVCSKEQAQEWQRRDRCHRRHENDNRIGRLSHTLWLQSHQRNDQRYFSAAEEAREESIKNL